MFDVTDDKVVYNRKGISMVRLCIAVAAMPVIILAICLTVYWITTIDLAENIHRLLVVASYAVPVVVLVLLSFLLLVIPPVIYLLLPDVLYTYVFDKVGVHRLSPFGEIIIPWEDLKDYGFSFAWTNKDRDLEIENLIFSREYGKTYVFYFSDKEVETKRHERKDLKDVKIKWGCDFLNQERQFDYYAARKDGAVYRIILDFCASHTDVKPFLPVTINEYLYPEVESPTSKFL